jgi:hypothetical protein
MLRRTAVLGMFLAAFMGLSSVGAMASPPAAAANDGPNSARYCLSEGGFTLVNAASFTQALAVDGTGNDNGWACVKVLPTPDNAAAQVVAMDDRDRVSS